MTSSSRLDDGLGSSEEAGNGWLLDTVEQIKKLNLSETRGIVPLVQSKDVTYPTSGWSEEGNTSADINEIAPAHSLPPELLGLIFELVLNAIPPDTKRFLKTITQVTRHWRAVALNAPYLWTQVDISYPWNEEAIQASISRSQSSPIHLTLSFHCGKGEDGSDPESPFERERSLLQSIIIPAMTRCRSAVININSTSDSFSGLAALLPLLEDVTVPLLEKFTFVGPEIEDKAPPPFTIFSGGAPVLKDLRLIGHGPLQCLFPLKNVQVMHLAMGHSCLTFSEFRDMLSNCESLITLAVYDDLITEWFVTGEIPPTPLPHLRSLQIYGNMRSVSQLLMSISAPQLEDLVIAPVVLEDLILLDEQNTRLSRFPKYTSIKSLTLAPAHADAYRALRLASNCFPAVETLVLSNIYEDLFENTFPDIAMSGERAGGTVWPNLQTLAVRDIALMAGDNGIRRLVKMRKVSGHPLKRLCFDEESATRLKWLIEELRSELIVEEVDMWKLRQQEALYSDEEDRFVGTPSE